jgi:hypothetical protein
MRTLFKVALSMLLLAGVLIGVSYSMLRAEGVSNPTSVAGRAVRGEKRPLGDGISKVDLNGPINLTLRQGSKPSLRVRGEQRLLANIDTTADGDTLHIGTRGMLFHHRQPLQVELVLPQLDQLDVRGSGDSAVTGFSGEHVSLNLTGSGNLNFSGRFRQLVASVRGSGDLNVKGGDFDKVELEMIGSGQLNASGNARAVEATVQGSGDLDAQHLASDRVELTLEGSGTANVYARDSADLILHGSGDIRVYGKPAKRNVTRTGSGEIKWE